VTSGLLAEFDCGGEITTGAGRVKSRRSLVQQTAEPRPPLHTMLRGHRLFIAWAVWIAVTVLALVIFVANVPVAYTWLHTVCTGCGDGFWRLSPEDVKALEELNLSIGFYAAYNVAFNIIYALGFYAVGIFIVLKKPDDWMALFTSLALILYGTDNPSWLGEAYPGLWLPVTFVSYLGSICFFIFFYLFPNGRFVPRWTRVLAAIWIAYQVPVYFFPASPFSGTTWPPLLKSSLWLGLLSTLVVAQVYRYVRVSGPVEREQTKWLVFGWTAVIALFIAYGLVSVPFPPLVKPGVPGVLYTLVSRIVIDLAFLLVPLSIAIAILRYHLWDIDVILNRTLVYGSLSAVLAAVFAITDTLLLPTLVETILGEEDASLNAIISAVIIAVLFEPLRRRIKAGVHRLVDWLAGGDKTSQSPRLTEENS
jgi:hypothetical protein